MVRYTLSLSIILLSISANSCEAKIVDAAMSVDASGTISRSAVDGEVRLTVATQSSLAEDLTETENNASAYQKSMVGTNLSEHMGCGLEEDGIQKLEAFFDQVAAQKSYYEQCKKNFVDKAREASCELRKQKLLNLNSLWMNLYCDQPWAGHNGDQARSMNYQMIRGKPLLDSTFTTRLASLLDGCDQTKTPKEWEQICGPPPPPQAPERPADKAFCALYLQWKHNFGLSYIHDNKQIPTTEQLQKDLQYLYEAVVLRSFVNGRAWRPSDLLAYFSART